jgi:hypothetical protein
MLGFDKKAPSPLRSAGALLIDRFQSKAPSTGCTAGDSGFGARLFEEICAGCDLPRNASAFCKEFSFWLGARPSWAQRLPQTGRNGLVPSRLALAKPLRPGRPRSKRA